MVSESYPSTVYQQQPCPLLKSLLRLQGVADAVGTEGLEDLVRNFMDIELLELLQSGVDLLNLCMAILHPITEQAGKT
jgi:hypothetical protein